MAQKVNPISLRLGKTNRSFDFSWFNDSNYVYLLMKDLKIQSYINLILKQINYSSARYSIQNLPNKTKVNVFFYNPNKNRKNISKVFYLSNKKKVKNLKKDFLNKKKIRISTKQNKIFQFLNKNIEYEKNFLIPSTPSLGITKNYTKSFSNLHLFFAGKSPCQGENYSNLLNYVKKFNTFFIKYFLIKYFSLNNNYNFFLSKSNSARKSPSLLPLLCNAKKQGVSVYKKKNIFFNYTMNFLFFKMYKNTLFLNLHYFEFYINMYKNIINTNTTLLLNEKNKSKNKHKVNFQLHSYSYKENTNLITKLKILDSFSLNTDKQDKALSFFDKNSSNKNSLYFYNSKKNPTFVGFYDQILQTSFLSTIVQKKTDFSLNSFLISPSLNVKNLAGKSLSLLPLLCNAKGNTKKQGVVKEFYTEFKPLLCNAKNLTGLLSYQKENQKNFSGKLLQTKFYQNQEYITLSKINNTSLKQIYSRYCILNKSFTYYNSIFSANANVHTLTLFQKPYLHPFLIINPPYKNHIESILQNSFSCNINLQFFKTTNMFQNALFFINEIIYYIEKRVPFFKIKNYILRKLIEQKQTSFNVKGIKVICSGRVGGKSKKAQRSKIQSFKYGETSLHVFSSKIDFKAKNAFTSFGTLGVKVWVCYT